MSTNKPSLQYSTIRRIIQSSSCTKNTSRNHKLTYEIVRKLIHTSPTRCRNTSSTNMSSKEGLTQSIEKLKSFCYPGEVPLPIEIEKGTHTHEGQTPLVASKTSVQNKAHMFVSKDVSKSHNSESRSVQQKGKISQVAKGKSWITVKVD